VGKETGIEWCDHTFNPWRGCTKVSAGCAHCYAEATSRRNPAILGEWGPLGRRVVAVESGWAKPPAWDRDAARDGERRRVFCASLADVFEDRPELVGPRSRLFALIEGCRHLDWLLLTKRPGGIMDRLRECGDPPGGLASQWLAGDPPANVWLGTSIEDQGRADERIPILLAIPAAVRFLSVEPLLGPIDFPTLAGISWTIVGGESGPGARPCDVGWVRSIVGQCRSAGVAPFVKQDSGPKSGRQGRIPDDIWAIKEFPG
jgi:protein gp37